MARTPSLKIDRWIKRHENKHLCKCECGSYVEIQRIHYRTGIPSFIRGHNFETFNPSKGLVVPKELSLWDSLSENERERRLSNLKSFPIGESHPNWNGGETITESGYRHIRVYNHPHSSTGYFPEHRLFIEAWMKVNAPDHQFMIDVNGEAYLRRDTVIHHRNEIKTCNDIENLIFMQNQSTHLRWHQSLLSEEEKFIKFEENIFCPWIKE